MSKDPLKNWQLEEGGEPLAQWKLQDTEQELGHMQLQTTDGMSKDWQPVEYQRPPGKSGRNWILPSIVIVALLVALGYVGYVSMNRLGIDDLINGTFGLASGDPTPASAGMPPSEATAVTPTEAPTVAPAPTTAPPTPLPTAPPEPSPAPALISVRSGTVNDTAGVNARREPSTDAEIIRLLNNAERVTVVRSEGEWLQVILADNQAAWVSAQFIDQAVGEEKTIEEWNATLAAAGLPLVTPETSPGSVEAQATPVGLPVNVTVTADPGATVRLEPAAESQVVGEALLNTVLVATARTDAADWLLVTLPDGRRGWMLSGLITASSDATTLPIQPANLLLTTSIIAPTATPLSPAGATSFTLTVSDAAPAAPYTNTLPVSGQAIAISDTLGVNARTAPTLTATILSVLPNGAVLPVTGRSGDGLWLQVRLPDSQLAWVFREAVNVSSNIEEAPIVGEGGDIAAPATPAAPDGAATATITSLLGSNVRTTPGNDSEPIETASRGTVFPATGRSADSTWLQVQLADGASGWVLATTADLNVDVATLPVAP
ncbi:SH3 domain-containing protein [Caldilinea sp.]|uniref:SH3 domain-containing protein n=1 Tax=Caldilinea sp. TaxID=2293560 RepID=UPI002BC350B6|nr:SH3 domain-containing protein [Caldilinea sp.]